SRDREGSGNRRATDRIRNGDSERSDADSESHRGGASPGGVRGGQRGFKCSRTRWRTRDQGGGGVGGKAAPQARRGVTRGAIGRPDLIGEPDAGGGVGRERTGN